MWSSPHWRSSLPEYLRAKFQGNLWRNLNVRSLVPPGCLIWRNVPYITFVRTARRRFTSVPMVCTSITLSSSAIGRPQDAIPEWTGRRLSRIYPRRKKPIYLAASGHVRFRILWNGRYICRLVATATNSANAATASRSLWTARLDCILTRRCPSAIGHG